MRTTVDIPDGMYRQLKSRAAREGSSTRALILRDVKESAATYGVAIFRADVKDLIFPGNLQEIVSGIAPAQQVVSNALEFQNTAEQ